MAKDSKYFFLFRFSFRLMSGKWKFITCARSSFCCFLWKFNEIFLPSFQKKMYTKRNFKVQKFLTSFFISFCWKSFSSFLWKIHKIYIPWNSRISRGTLDSSRGLKGWRGGDVNPPVKSTMYAKCINFTTPLDRSYQPLLDFIPHPIPIENSSENDKHFFRVILFEDCWRCYCLQMSERITTFFSSMEFLLFSFHFSYFVHFRATHIKNIESNTEYCRGVDERGEASGRDNFHFPNIVVIIEVEVGNIKSIFRDKFPLFCRRRFLELFFMLLVFDSQK